MKTQDEFILVSAPTKAGEAFLQALKAKGLPAAALANNETEKKRLEQSGVKHIFMVDTRENAAKRIPELPIGKVFLFEHSLTLCCRYLQICRPWTRKAIYVITQGDNARLIYRGIGANYVIHSHGKDFSFLLD